MTPEARTFRKKNVRIAPQAFHPFLNPGPSRVIEPDHRGSDLKGQIHDLDDFGGIGGAQRAAENRKILGKDVYRAPLYGPVSGNDTVSINPLFFHAEIVAVMDHQLVRLLEGSLVQQKVYPLAGGELSGLVLAFDSLLSSTELSQLFPSP